jgi:excisionase family DNA binding protein
VYTAAASPGACRRVPKDERTSRGLSDSDGSNIGAGSVMGRFLTVAEVARELRVSNMTVYRLVKSGQLAAVRVGRGYRIREEDIRRYLQQRYMDAG